MEIGTVAVVGAGGQMGGLFADRCELAGLDVVELDKPLPATPEAMRAALAGADVVLLCVPIPAMREVLAAVAPALDGRQILADVCSVKELPVSLMCEAYAGPVVGTHPLFGPVPPAPEDRRVAVAPGRPGRNDAAAEAVSKWLRHLGFTPFASTPVEHDRAMAYVQALNFVTTVAYFSCMADEPGIENYLTPSFRRRLAAAEKMLTEDGQLFEAIFEANPESQDMVRLYRSHLNVAAGGDVSLLLERARLWWKEAR